MTLATFFHFTGAGRGSLSNEDLKNKNLTVFGSYALKTGAVTCMPRKPTYCTMQCPGTWATFQQAQTLSPESFKGSAYDLIFYFFAKRQPSENYY